MVSQNLTYVVAEVPKEELVLGKNLQPKTEPAPTAADLTDGQVLIETLYLSIDPSTRNWFRQIRSYVPPAKVGDVVQGGALSRVLSSRSPKTQPGDVVFGYTGWRKLAIVQDAEIEVQPTDLPGQTHLTDLVGILGPTGMTAWVGINRVGQPKKGETVVISGAAGAVGYIAGQMAKLRGARVIGLVGSEDKARWLTEELGFDEALNYKDVDFKMKFAEATPNFIDVYWDNVGGEILDMALARANVFSRFVMCGALSQYNETSPQGPTNYFNIVMQRVKVQGFFYFDHPEDLATARKELSELLAEGKIKKRETLLKGGLPAAEKALIGLFHGINTGKCLVEIKGVSEEA